MTSPTYDQDFWEQLWSRTLREHGEKVAHRPPNAWLVAEASRLRPGRVLDAGCGHGAEALWLAAQGWEVTAVDFSASALAQGRSMADAMGADVAARIAWVEGDLATWEVPTARFDLVACLYVHIAGSVEAMVRRMAAGVAVGGTLLMLGHRPFDPVTQTDTRAAGQVQLSVDSAVAALDPRRWELIVAEERPRAEPGSGVDAALQARCR